MRIFVSNVMNLNDENDVCIRVNDLFTAPEIKYRDKDDKEDIGMTVK